MQFHKSLAFWALLFIGVITVIYHVLSFQSEHIRFLATVALGILYIGILIGCALTYLFYKHIRNAPIIEEGELIIIIPREAIKTLRDLQQYMEFKSVVTLVRMSLAYFKLTLDKIKNDEGEIIFRDKQGYETKIDPVSAIIGDYNED